MSEITIFLHMPKTGGTTLNSIIRNMYDHERLYATPEVIIEHYGRDWKQAPPKERWQFARDTFASLPESEKKDIDAVFGHLWFGWHKATERSCRYVTFLRHPVHRFVSYYNYMRNLDNHPVAEKIQTLNMDFEDFLKERELSNLPSNQQIKFLTGDFDPTLHTLKRAVENVKNHFLFVGLTEYFDADLLHLAKLAGWSTPYYTRQNTSRKKITASDLEPAVVHKIMQMNSLDMALYEHVKSSRSYRKSGQTRIFQILNRLHSTSVAQHLRRAI